VIRLRLYRTPADGTSTVFFAGVDTSAPLVDGVTIVGTSEQLAEVPGAASAAGLTSVARRWPDGRRALFIQDRRSS